MINIGSYKAPSNVFLAPMAGCTDLPFRLIAREHGAKFCFFEMIDANSVTRRNIRTIEMLKNTPEDSPIAAQLVGTDPELMLAAAKMILQSRAISFLDVNSACPVRKVVRKGGGAALADDTAKLWKMIKTLVEGLPIPVTLKLRTGFAMKDNDHLVEVAQGCERHGASAIFIHGRTAKQGYSGEVDYTGIKLVKDSVKIPVFGSGNVFTPELAAKMLRETGCDGVLVARGALGNPWIFDAIDRYLATGESVPLPDWDVRRKTLMRHMELIGLHKKARKTKFPLNYMRKAAIWYIKNFTHSHKVRGLLGSAKTYDQMVEIIQTDLTE